jgi:DNA-binding XRE family transcriptional regulator
MLRAPALICADMLNTAQPDHRSLRELRRRAALSSRKLADLAGVAQTTVLNAERGSLPRWETQDAIAAALSDVLGEMIDPLTIWPLDEAAA